MGAETRLPHINFHIGAPRIASDIVHTAGKIKELRTATHCRILTSKEFQKHIRPTVNGTLDVSTLVGADTDEEGFWKNLRECEVLAASQHAMMGHPNVVFKAGTILPNAERRIERLSGLFEATSLDLHLTIMNQLAYLSRLPTKYLTQEDTRGLNEAIPSWFDLVARIQQVCPSRRILIWDFDTPEKVALPFVMTVLNVDEALADVMRKPVSESITHNKLISKVFHKNILSEDVSMILDTQYEKDLENIQTMGNVVLIRGEKVPADLHV
ncbi:MAG: hypothetical protein PVI41_05345 [Roseobacter sp.]|jgi:hypothetical protein